MVDTKAARARLAACQEQTSAKRFADMAVCCVADVAPLCDEVDALRKEGARLRLLLNDEATAYDIEQEDPDA